MRRLQLYFVLCGSLAACWPALATSGVFIEADWENPVRLADTNSGFAIWAGGNLGEPSFSSFVPAPSAVITDTNNVMRRVYLVESAIGQMTSGTLAYADATTDLISRGQSYLASGSRYATFDSLTGQLQRPAGAWDIVFPGTIDLYTGQPPTNKTQNYFETDIRTAERAFRAALRIDPFNTNAAQGILQSLYLRTVPLTFAGNNAFVYATRARLVSQNPFLGETGALTNALGFFQQAQQVLITAATNPADAQLLESLDPYLVASDLAHHDLLLVDSFARAVALEGETALRLARLNYLNGYNDPTGPSFDVSPVLRFIDLEARSMRAAVLFGSLFSYLDGFTQTDFGKAEYSIETLVGLRAPYAQGRLVFSGYQETNTTVTASSQSDFRDYTARFVPFFFPQDSAIRSSFKNLLTEAVKFVSYSQAADTAAKSANREFDSDTSQINARLSDLSTRYRSELADLCGVIRDPDGNLQPDVFLALFPAADRQRIGQQLLNDPTYLASPGNNSGKLYQQWNQIQQALTKLQAAELDLTNTFAEMQEKQKIANEITHGEENIAYLIMDDGTKLKALDREEGEVKAALARTEARIKAQAAVAAGAVAAADTGIRTGLQAAGSGGPVAGLFAGLGAAGASAAETYINVKATYALGDAQADADRKEADIQAQRTQISTMERAKIQFEQRDENLLRTEEAMYALMLQAERQKLNILLAVQDLDSAQAGAVNMVARVQFLLQEYRANTQLVLSDPLASPDYRLIRDLAVQSAEDAFALGQEWVYLATKSGQYRVNGAAQAPGVNALIKQVLAARQGDQLASILATLDSSIAQLEIAQGHPESIQRETISFRHYLFQNDYAITDTNGVVLAGSQLEATETNLTSDQVWVRFLQGSLSGPAGGQELDLVFSTALNQPYRAITNQAFARRDFLFRHRLFNALLSYDSQTPGAYGIRVNLKTKGLDYDRTRDGELVINLRQEGASYIRSRPWDQDPTAVNVWNLEPLNADVVPFLNGFQDILDRRATARFNERSPANDRWVLSLLSEGGNGVILANLDKLTDIEIEFNFTGYSQ